MKSNIRKYIFTTDLDYSKTSIQSIWGDGDLQTLQVLKKLISEKKIFGDWLHFAAGDGRYNNILLREVNKVVATDIDEVALEKLQKTTTKEHSSKLVTQIQNIAKPFPFKDNIFDGVFNTGTLHLFSRSILEKVMQETYRVLKPGGLFIFDFATDIKRLRQDGSFVGRSNAIYSKFTAKSLLTELLRKQKLKAQFIACVVAPEKVTTGETYTFSCNYWLIVARK